jgi:hypothetical protein
LFSEKFIDVSEENVASIFREALGRYNRELIVGL